MPDRHEIAEQLFEAALSLTPGARQAFLDRQCARDPELRHMVDSLFAEDGRLGSFLEHPPLEDCGETRIGETRIADPENTGPAVSTDRNGVPPVHPPTGRLSPGEPLNDRFIIVRFIARGGMGEVYEVEDRYLQGFHVAMKTILPHIADDPELRQRFESEVLLARQVTHPNLCPIYEIFHCDQPPPGFLFLTMKLLPGETLAQRLRSKSSTPVEEKLAIVRQMCAGLVAIHDAGIVHRDIKPNNIMLDGSGPNLHLWITDFGLARAFETETTLHGRGGVAGTPGYIAPELLLGHPASQATDLFAFGIVLYQLFTGERPAFETDGSVIIASSRLNHSGMPSFCNHLVRECLDKDPMRRCQAFDQALVSLGLKRRRLKPWTRRQFITTAAAGAWALAGVGWWEWDRIEDLIHPLPQKRFVALLNWPKATDSRVVPMLTGVLDAIKSDLARIESVDHDLFVITPEDCQEDVSRATRLKEVCDPLGANLVLAASASPAGKYLEILLRVLDPQSNRTLRHRTISCAPAEVTSLPTRAVRVVASLLGLEHYMPNESETPGTQSGAAFTAFQAAEALQKEPNDSGLEAAIEKYKEAIELDPRFAVAHADLAMTYGRLYALRRDPAALDLARGNCEVALRLDPNLVEGHLALASVLQQKGDEQGALDQIGKALALDPSNPRTLVWQAQIYGDQGRWADAERTYNRVIVERPNYWMAYNELGVVLNQQGKYQEAIRAFRSASLSAPGNALAFNNLGAIYLQIGDFSEATDNFKKSLGLKPNGMAASNTSLALRSQGKYSEALPFARKSVEIEPQNDVNWLELGDCYSCLRGRRAEAISAYQRAAKEAEEHLETNPHDGSQWMSLALYRAKSGSPQQALSLMQKAESLGAGDMDSQLTKARILEILGRRQEALNTLAACFRKGATRFEIAPVPDFGALQKDPRYQEILQSHSVAEAGQASA